jgi:hypothetical protein
LTKSRGYSLIKILNGLALVCQVSPMNRGLCPENDWSGDRSSVGRWIINLAEKQLFLGIVAFQNYGEKNEA